jgi:hypothetical protein
MSIVPPLNLAGTYTVKTPFVLVAGVSYTCIAQREYKDLVINNISVYDRFYSPYGISQADYEADVKNNAVMITLFSDDAPTVYIPSTYILSYPDLSAITFRHRVLSISMGAIPDSMPLDDFVSKVASLASDVLGVEPTVSQHSVSLSTTVSTQAANAFEAARQARIKDRTTEHAQLLAAQAENAELRQRNSLLEEVLANSGLTN